MVLEIIWKSWTWIDDKCCFTERAKNKRELNRHAISLVLDKIYDFCLGAKTSMYYDPFPPNEDQYLHNGKILHDLDVDNKDFSMINSHDFTIRLSESIRNLKDINKKISDLSDVDDDGATDMLRKHYPHISGELISLYREISKKYSIHVTDRDEKMNEIELFMIRKDVYYNNEIFSITKI
jgi:hypothetical protein